MQSRKCNSKTSLRKPEISQRGLWGDVSSESPARGLRDLQVSPLWDVSETLYETSQRCIWDPSMPAGWVRYLCKEIFKSFNNINPSFMKQIFKLRETNRTVWNQYKLNLSVPKVNQHGEKSLGYYGTPFCFMSRLLKILTLSKALLKIREAEHVTVGCVRVELN